MIKSKNNISFKVLTFCLAFLTGVILVSFIQINNFTVYILFLITAVAAVFIYENKKILLPIIIIFLIGLLLGIFRFNLSFPSARSVWHLPTGAITFQGEITALPSRKTNKQSFTLDNIIVNNKTFKDKILITANLYPVYNLGQKLTINCELKTPGQIANFNYGEYLANQRIYKVCYYPEIKTLDAPDLFSTNPSLWFATTRLYFANLINQHFSPPHSALLSAIILGERSEINSATRQMFSQVGLAHIIAISGLHISILSLIIFNIFLLLGFTRKKSFKFIVIILILYLLLIGFKASAVRAVIMGLILAYGAKEGRLSESGRSIVLAATFLLLLNPRLLRWDVGFQLSFVATLGIAYFSSYFSQPFNFLLKIPKIPESWTQTTQQILAMTLSAQVATWPLVVYHFGILSISGVITNLLVLPTLALLLQFGILFLIIAPLLPPPFIYVFIFPVWLILSYILTIGKLFSQLPFTYFEFTQINFIWIILSYVLIILLYFWLKRKSEIDY